MGFIYTPQGEEALVTINNVIDQKPLVAAEMVEYEVIVSAKGKRAVNVSRVNGRFQPYYGFVSQWLASLFIEIETLVENKLKKKNQKCML